MRRVAGRAAARRVVVVGGGYGGATVAKYLDLWSNGTLDITLVEPNPAFVSCPLSNLVLGGSKQIADLTVELRRPRRSAASRCVADTAHGRRPGPPDRAHQRPAGPAVRPPRAVAGRRLHVRPGAGARQPRRAGEGPARVEGGPADRRAAPAARGDARRRRVRDLDPEGAVPLPARARTSARARSRGTSSARSRAARC